MAIRYSLISNLSCYIDSAYVISCEGSKLRGHTDTLREAYEAATQIGTKTIDSRVEKRAVVHIHGRNESGRPSLRPQVATVQFTQLTNDHSTWGTDD